MFRFFLFFIIAFGVIGGVEVLKVLKLENTNLLIQKETIFSLKPNTGAIVLSKQLYRRKMIDHPYLFRCLLLIKPKLANLKAGTYRFMPGITTGEMLKLLVSGKEAQFPLRLIEGMCLKNYLEQLHKAVYLKHLLENDKYETVITALKLKNIKSVEGWFWPDTWMYTANTSDIALLERAHKKMVNIVKKVWQERTRGLPYKDQNQLVTMASILEKEAATAVERNRIASVLVNRLRLNMHLQTDVTVIYGMGCNYNGKIFRKDLQNPTPYNTYIINGLPPSAIANPGQISLNAAAHPAITSYLYFVANGKGGHDFNTNLVDHNRSVQNYLEVVKKNNAR